MRILLNKTLNYFYFGTKCNLTCELIRYTNDNIGLNLIDNEDNCLFATATINIDKLDEGFTIIKNYSENEGILELLLENNVVSLTGKSMGNGFINCPIVKVNIDQFISTK